jgi:hypothetical protein
MTARRSLFALSLVLLLLAGGVFQLHRVTARQHAEANALAQRHASLETELAALLHAQQAGQRDLEAASHQLAQLPPPATGPERARELEVQTWLGRTKRLRQLFVDRPGQAIPELRLLTDAEWLRLGRKARFDTEAEIRQALAAARDIASGKIAARFSSAVSKYMNNSNGEQPASILALLPYFDSPPDLAMVQRFEVAPLEGRMNRNGSAAWQVQEATPIDADYDSRNFLLSTSGAGRMGAPAAWIPHFAERSTLANAAYAAANNGTSPQSFADTAPFFKPPLDPALVQKMVEAERARKK